MLLLLCEQQQQTQAAIITCLVVNQEEGPEPSGPEPCARRCVCLGTGFFPYLVVGRFQEAVALGPGPAAD